MIFVDDPYKGNINSDISEGAKLYMKVTASIDNDDKFDINISNVQKILDYISRDTNTFGWGILVRTVYVGQTEFKNILVDHKDITAEDIERQAYQTWSNHLASF